MRHFYQGGARCVSGLPVHADQLCLTLEPDVAEIGDGGAAGCVCGTGEVGAFRSVENVCWGYWCDSCRCGHLRGRD